jgi:uncharacterized protein (DUF1684 family)
MAADATESESGGSGGSGGSGAAATLALADWRRRVADLYADVRRIAATDPRAAFDLWRGTRERLYREHVQSPVPADRRATFRAGHFDYDPALRFEVAVEPDADAADPHDEAGPPAGGFALPMSVGGAMSFRRIGHVTVTFAAGERRLGLFWMAGYSGGLFLPFRDATNGRETYAAGRYLLDAAKAADLGAGAAPGSLVLDFNFAFQPSCAFDPAWACPLAPPENRLDVEVRAGERID